MVLFLLLFLLSRAFGHPLLRLCPPMVLAKLNSTRTTCLEEENTYTDIPNKKGVTPLADNRGVTYFSGRATIFF